ncbi:MAG TPA: ribokinase [Phycisphaerales bacterium]|nr:ribokinase [Phycisphaerales bacterium]
MSGSVCVVGSINMDLVVRTPRLPAPGETILGGPFETFPGGKGANQAVAAARMGARVSMVGRVGADDYGQSLRALLVREGVDATAIRATAGTATGVGVIIVDERAGENTIVVAPGANASLTPEDVESVAGIVRSAAVLLVQLESPFETVEAAIRIARGAGRRVVLNAAPAAVVPEAMLRQVDLLVANRGEAALLTGGAEEDDPRTLARDALRLGPAAVVVTAGAEGACLAARDVSLRVPSIPVRAVDSTAAGDAFCGSVAAWLASGRSVEEAVRAGCVAGALAATRAGAIPSLPKAHDVSVRLSDLGVSVTC